MKPCPVKPHICAIVADARGTRLYSRQKSRISLLAAFTPQQASLGTEDIAIWLEEKLEELRVDRIVLIAPAAFLKALGRALNPRIYSRIIAEIKSNLTGGDAKVQAELKKILWF